MRMHIGAVVVSTVVAGLAAIVVVSAPGCSGGGFSCSSASKCSADPAPTQASISQCNTITAGACGSQYTDLGTCVLANQKCTANNTTDQQATSTAIQANCSTQSTAFLTCCAGNPNACTVSVPDAGGGG